MPEATNQNRWSKLSTFLTIISLILGIFGISYTALILATWGISVFGLEVNTYFYDWPVVYAHQFSLTIGPLLYLYIIFGFKKIKRNLWFSFTILLLAIIFIAVGPFELADRYRENIPHYQVPPTLQTFETELKNGVYSNETNATARCLDILQSISSEVNSASVRFTNSCIYLIAIHFDDPMMCRENIYPHFINTEPYVFDELCLEAYGITRKSEAKCLTIPDYKVQSSKDSYVYGTHGQYPRDYCIQMSHSNQSSRFDNI